MKAKYLLLLSTLFISVFPVCGMKGSLLSRQENNGLTFTVQDHEVQFSDLVVQLSGTLLNIQKEAEQEEMSGVPVVRVSETIPWPTVRGFLRLLMSIAQQLDEGRSKESIQKQIREAVIRGYGNELPLEKACFYAVLSYYFDVEIVKNPLCQGLADRIKRKQRVEDRLALVSTITALTNDVIGLEVSNLLSVKERLEYLNSKIILESGKSVNNCAAFSPDLSKVAMGSYDGIIRIWSTHTGKLLKKLHGSIFTQIAFSPDGFLLVAGSEDKSVRIWDVQTGQEIRELVGHTAVVNSVAFSQDGSKIVSGGKYSEAVRVWDTQTGSLLKVFKGYQGDIESLAFNSDGSAIVAAVVDYESDLQSIIVWDINSKNPPKNLRDYTAVTFSRDNANTIIGAFIKNKVFTKESYTTEEGVQTIDRQTGTILKTFERKTHINQLVISPDGSKLAGASMGNKKIHIWDVQTGRLIEVINCPPIGYFSFAIAFSPDASKLALGQAGKVYLLPPFSNQIESALRSLSLIQSAAILSYIDARERQRSFDWNDYPQILPEMRDLPDELQKLLGIPVLELEMLQEKERD